MTKKTNTRKIAKSAVTGRIVTEAYLKKNPKTTFMDTVPIRNKKKK